MQEFGSRKKCEQERQTNKEENQTSQKETICPFCFEFRKEDLIQCENCKNWVPQACGNIPELSNQYICDYCYV